MLIETFTFRLAADADETAFLEADRRVQTEFIPRHHGFMRRTTAHGGDGEWLVVVLWDSEDDARASMELAEEHPATRAFHALLDPTTLHINRYETLD